MISKELKKLNVTWLDFETTGLDINNDEPVSVYAINYKQKVEIDTLVNPSVQIKPEAENVHGISKKNLKNKPTFHKIVNSFNELIESSTYIGGYNICKFDVPMYISMVDKNNSAISNIKSLKYIDVFYIVKNVLDEDDLNSLSRINLESVYKLITGNDLDAHKAKYDVIACIEILNELEKHNLPWRDYILEYNDLTGVEISDLNYKLKFGKHLNRTIGDLINNESSYLKFMTSKGYIKLSSELQELI